MLEISSGKAGQLKRYQDISGNRRGKNSFFLLIAKIKELEMF